MPWPPPLLWPSLCTHSPIPSTLYLYHLLSLSSQPPMSPCLPRICYSDTSCPQEDQYPPNIAVKVNHSYCSVPVSEPAAAWGRGDMDAG